MVAFHKQIAELSRAVQGTVELADGLNKRIDLIRQSLHRTPEAGEDLMTQAKSIKDRLTAARRKLRGDWTISRRSENQPPSIYGRVRTLAYSQWQSTSSPTQTMKDQYRIIGEEFEPVLAEIKQMAEVDFKNLESAMEAAGAPWTPGRVPEWEK
jgi:hypothetical protein